MVKLQTKSWWTFVGLSTFWNQADFSKNSREKSYSFFNSSVYSYWCFSKPTGIIYKCKERFTLDRELVTSDLIKCCSKRNRRLDSDQRKNHAQSHTSLALTTFKTNGRFSVKIFSLHISDSGHQIADTSLISIWLSCLSRVTSFRISCSIFNNFRGWIKLRGIA